MQITLARDSALIAAAIPDSETEAAVPRGHPVFGPDARCTAPSPRDTVQLMLYATVDGRRPLVATDAEWTQFMQRTLVAVDRSFALPSDLPVPVFSAPSGQTVSAGSDDQGARRATVVPVLSSAVTFDLDTTGSVANLRIAASSLSGPADTSVLAAVERAQVGGVLPPLPRAWAVSGVVQLRLAVFSGGPPRDVPSRRVGVTIVPEWLLDRQATLDSVDQSALRPQSHCTRISGRSNGRFPCLDTTVGDTAAFAGDSATFSGIIDAHGRVVIQSVRFVQDNSAAFTKRVIEMLPHVTFTPARIGSCAVSELAGLTFYLPAGQ
jgi:hypothetical protein